MVIAIGCGRPSSARAGEPATAGSAAAQGTAGSAGAPAPKASKFHPDDDPACNALATLTSATDAWMTAASPQPHHHTVEELWPTVAPQCRGGTFYLVAAELVGRAPDARIATADGAAVVRSPADALAHGLAAEPDHPGLLAHLAFALDVVPREAPPLPADACERARDRGDAWADDVAYVCALAAIHASDGATALAELDRIRYVRPFPDLKARRVLALRLADKRKEAQALVKSAETTLAQASSRFDLTTAAKTALKNKLAAH